MGQLTSLGILDNLMNSTGSSCGYSGLCNLLCRIDRLNSLSIIRKIVKRLLSEIKFCYFETLNMHDEV